MPRITKASLDRYAAIAAESLELGRKVRALQAEAKAIEAAARADLTSSGKESISRGGYRLEMVEGRPSIAWKEELVSRLGAQIAIQIAADAERPKKLRITPPAV